jgi:hypothetical protein
MALLCNYFGTILTVTLPHIHTTITQERLRCGVRRCPSWRPGETNSVSTARFMSSTPRLISRRSCAREPSGAASEPSGIQRRTQRDPCPAASEPSGIQRHPNPAGSVPHSGIRAQRHPNPAGSVPSGIRTQRDPAASDPSGIRTTQRDPCPAACSEPSGIRTQRHAIRTGIRTQRDPKPAGYCI